MSQADLVFRENIESILNYGTFDENPRPRYASDNIPAHSLYITQVFEKYNLQEDEFPISELRPIPIKNGIKEIQWIYQDQNSSLETLEEKHHIFWWRDWDIGDGTIGKRYGATVRQYDLINKLLHNLKQDPFGRRHIMNLWQENDFSETAGLPPCAFMTMWTVRQIKGVMYLDMTLTQRSSDFLVAGHINKMQYVALQMMVAKHLGYELGFFSHFVQNLHIYDRHIEQANILLSRKVNYESKPVLKLNVPDKTNFFDITADDFEMVDYNPIKPQLKFDLGV